MSNTAKPVLEDRDDLDDLDATPAASAATVELGSAGSAASPTPAKSAAQAAPPAAASNAEAYPPTEDIDLDEFETMFASKLKVGMESLVQELGDSTDTQQQFEAMLKEISKITEPDSKRSPAAAATTKAAPASTTSTTGEKVNFQDTISQTMNRLNESKQEIDKSVLESADDDFLAKMMKDLESAMGSGDGSDMDMSKLINEMLEQMASKEILYEPMKEMYDKYPAWMEENEKKISADDRSRYLNQYRIISDVVLRFEKPEYSDDNEVDRKYITALMEQMQSSGAPPPELMGDLASGSIPGLDMGADGLPKVPGDLDGCPTQ
ncbi:hypothetical protein DV451_001082 [Geotrichum candidum]|uniref:Uncharacterized protein n=1 Tax=Geotrichum candidum TaxID=1173061 RepID=A0A9P5KW51_GEOCN|nr:hypothetical protein DV451_001082 [Geotrichum candidum]KAF5108397.1 hypothetical protein DV453_002357 [Geotrichum candidum]